MTTAPWVRETLRRSGISFKEMHHGLTWTSEELARDPTARGAVVTKTVVVVAARRPVVLVLPADRQVDLGRVADILQVSDVRLASEGEIRSYCNDCEVGAAPPLRHWKVFDVIMDRSLRGACEVVFPAGSHEDAVRLQFGNWFDLVRPRVESFSRHRDRQVH